MTPTGSAPQPPTASRKPHGFARQIFTSFLVVGVCWVFLRFGSLIVNSAITHIWGPESRENLVYNFLFKQLIMTFLYPSVLGLLRPAFIPLYNDILEAEGTDAAHRFAQGILQLGALVGLLIAGVFWFFPEQTVTLMGRGFGPEVRDAIVPVMRQMAPGVLFLFTSGMYLLVFHAERKFAYPHAAEAVHKIGWGLGILVVGKVLGLESRAIGLTYTGACAVQLLVSLVGVVRTFGWSTGRPRLPEWFRRWGTRTAILLVPLLVGMLAARLRDWLTLHYQSELGTVSFNSIENARTLTNLPIAFLGQIVSLVMLPFLSGVLHQGGAAEHRRVLENTIETLCLVSLPVVAVFLVLAPELVSLVFIPAEWDAQTTQFCYQAGLATRLISLAFTLMVLENILLPGLFSIKSLWWPILWGVAASFLQLVWLLGLARIRDSIDPLLVLLGVACAYPLSRVCKNGILLLVLRRKTGLFPGRRFLRTGLRLALILAGTLGACALAKLGTRAVLGGIPTQAGVSLLRYKLTLVVQLAIPGAVCGLAFLALTLALGYGHHLQSLIRNLRDRKRRQGNSDALSTPEA